MLSKDLRYLLGCLPPLISAAGLYLGGWFSPGIIYVGLILLPLLELFLPVSTHNETEDVYARKSRVWFFDLLLYVQLPMLYAVIFYFFWKIPDMTVMERIFSILNVGMLMGISGINVAHELGHRKPLTDRVIARLLLVPALYTHYTLEHNYGHHLMVGTPEDPATARKNESLYAFYFRTITTSYVNAWHIGHKLRKAAGRSVWMHELIWMHFVQLIYLIVVWWFFGWIGFGMALGAALISVLFLEAVNYIEHYGLLRKKMASGRYEPMRDSHSWNSNHSLGRQILFELPRHADHHFQTTRKYQTLRHLDESPQLPYGYPLSILIAMIPPLWFRIMNPRISEM